MPVDKKILLAVLAGICISVATHSSSIFVANTLSISGSIGHTQFRNPANQTLIISDYVSDLLTNPTQGHFPTYNASVKQQLNIQPNIIQKIMFGPALYFQKTSHTGEVWEMFSSEFYNYNYHMRSSNINLLLEGDIYFKPLANHIWPFLTAGVGLGRAQTHYDDYAFPNIPVDSERHWSKTQTKAVYELGAGLALPVNSHWSLDLRYAWLYRGQSNSPIVQYQSINTNLNNQNVLLGIHYFL